MKTSLFAVVALSAGAHIAHGLMIPTAQLSHFLQEKDALELELIAWKESTAGQYAKQHDYFIPNDDHHVESDETALDDQLRRLFMTKLHIEQVQEVNPNAVFSTDTPFTLMTEEEFAAFVGSSYQRGGEIVDAVPAGASNSTDVDDASEKDWTTSGCVAPVKDQGQCGSCWSFAAVAALESAYCLKGNSLTLFSEQQVLSCDTSSYGCQGGFPGNGLTYVQQNGGICREDDYAYVSGTSGDSGQCETGMCTIQPIKIQQVAKVPESESGLVTAISGRPVAVGVAAGNNTWKQYKGGVVTTCASSQLDHAVLAVGYGKDNVPFFKIKNSWGATWGENGYIRLQRGKGGAGTCGIIGPKSVYPVL